MSEDRYLDTLEKTREAALAAVSSLPIAGQLQAIAAFHETACEMAKAQFGGRDTAISAYHGILRDAANAAASQLEAIH